MSQFFYYDCTKCVKQTNFRIKTVEIASMNTLANRQKYQFDDKILANKGQTDVINFR